jgi:hypothetical protein
MSHDHRSALRGVDENVGGGAPRGVSGKMTTPSSSSMRAEATTTTTPGGGDREVKEWKVRLYLSVCLRARLCLRARVFLTDDVSGLTTRARYNCTYRLLCAA